MIRQYVSNIINDYKTQGESKIQLTMEITILSTSMSSIINNLLLILNYSY